MRLIANLRGDDILIRTMHPPRLIGPPSHELMRRFGEIAREAVRDEAPQGVTGNLKGSIDFQADGGAISEWVRVGSNLDVAEWVHEGTKPHMPPVAAITPWALSKGIPPWALAIRIKRMGTLPNPFLRRGFARAETQIGHLMTVMARSVERRFGAG